MEAEFFQHLFFKRNAKLSFHVAINGSNTYERLGELGTAAEYSPQFMIPQLSSFSQTSTYATNTLWKQNAFSISKVK